MNDPYTSWYSLSSDDKNILLSCNFMQTYLAVEIIKLVVKFMKDCLKGDL